MVSMGLLFKSNGFRKKLKELVSYLNKIEIKTPKISQIGETMGLNLDQFEKELLDIFKDPQLADKEKLNAVKSILKKLKSIEITLYKKMLLALASVIKNQQEKDLADQRKDLCKKLKELREGLEKSFKQLMEQIENTIRNLNEQLKGLDVKITICNSEIEKINQEIAATKTHIQQVPYKFIDKFIAFCERNNIPITQEKSQEIFHACIEEVASRQQGAGKIEIRDFAEHAKEVVALAETKLLDYAKEIIVEKAKKELKELEESEGLVKAGAEPSSALEQKKKELETAEEKIALLKQEVKKLREAAFSDLDADLDKLEELDRQKEAKQQELKSLVTERKEIKEQLKQQTAALEKMQGLHETVSLSSEEAKLLSGKQTPEEVKKALPKNQKQSDNTASSKLSEDHASNAQESEDDDTKLRMR
ncbi:TPA: hypothetical protein DCQ85_03240 [Candidatus Magasanikbacteria bacterium]|nr:hypothetical protein [Candidatus Magasanikbacteria bacterium]